jgi:hypothetical protein
MQFSIFKKMKDKDKMPSKMQPKQGVVAPPAMPKKASSTAMKKHLTKNPGK